MNAEQFAAILNGRQYRSEITREEEKIAKANGLVVIFGASDDLREMCGAACDEIGARDGATVVCDGIGLITNQCGDDECPYFAERLRDGIYVNQDWCKVDGYSWTYTTDIPHHCFEIMEDDDHYCRGIVFALSEVKAAIQAAGVGVK